LVATSIVSDPESSRVLMWQHTEVPYCR